MANLPEITVSSLGDDQDKKLESIIRQLNEWQKLLTNDDLFSSFQIVGSGEVEVTKLASADDGIVAVEHNLNFVPSILAFVTDSDGLIYTPVPFYGVNTSGADAGLIYITYNASTSTVYAQFSIETPNYAGNTLFADEITAIFKYYLLRETPN